MTDKGTENQVEFGMYAETEIKSDKKPDSGSGNGDKPEEKSTKKSPGLIILNMILLIGLVVLYILHFTSDKKTKSESTSSLASYQPIISNEPGNGDMLFVNLDTINEYYALVEILMGDIEQESKRMEASLGNRRQAFQQKVNQFQQNMQAQILTEQQAMNAERLLSEEMEKLQSDFEAADMNIQSRQLAALRQIQDSIIVATQIVNAELNASYVVAHQFGGAFICVDPTKDITKLVLDQLNAYYENK